MKQTKLFLITSLLLFSASALYSQKYKTTADTVKLNKEYVQVSNDIAELTSKLTIAQNNLPGFQAKAGEATTDAQSSANASSQQAAKATKGDLSEAKSAKKKAKKAYRNAQHASNADDSVTEQEKK
ncbi:hypothetical protein [Pollutibacter soli]|uniref:hypothetical protein n=1 Tax=Pollutibacter soli TaxID=3034157 RepID=UPI0030135C0D